MKKLSVLFIRLVFVKCKVPTIFILFLLTLQACEPDDFFGRKHTRSCKDSTTKHDTITQRDSTKEDGNDTDSTDSNGDGSKDSTNFNDSMHVY